jgi:hypothetical protein
MGAEHDAKSSDAAATGQRIAAAPRTYIAYPVTWAAVFTAVAGVAGFGVVAGRTVRAGVDVGFVVAAGFTVTFGAVVGFGVAESAAPAAPAPPTATMAAPIASFRNLMRPPSSRHLEP